MAKFCKECGQRLKQDSKFCGECGSEIELSTTRNANKRQQVLGKKKSKFQIVNLILIVAFAGIIYLYFAGSSTKEEKIINNQPEVSGDYSYPAAPTRMAKIETIQKNGKIILPLDIVQKQKFVSFEYVGKNNRIPLLAYVSEAGKLVTAIRMCEPCNSKSFHIRAGILICDACGTTWKLENLDAISGGCSKYPPDPIPSKIEGNKIIINESSVVGWNRRI